MVNENVTILLISSSKLLKNKFIECLNDENNQNHFTLMNKTIESLKSVNERITVPCLICDYLVQQPTDEGYVQSNNAPPDTRYVQLVDATDKNLINNLISRSINTESNKNFQFKVNAIVYLYDETNSDTFAYIQTIHRDLQKTFRSYLMENDNFRFIVANMSNATVSSNFSEDESMRMLKLAESFLEQFNNNVQYVTQEFENSVLGSRPIQAIPGEENSLKINFDDLITRFNTLNMNPNLSKSSKKKEKESDDSYKIITSLTDSLQSANEEIKELTTNKLENSKKNYQGEMANNLRNGFGIYVYENKYFRYEGEWKNGKKHGMGKLVMRDGSYYEGEFKNGEIFGKGYKFNKSKESEYTGDFLEGLQHGKGTLRVRKHYTYQGDFFENMRHGYGELNEFKANRNYQGQWYYNKRHGQGIQRYPDGSTYTGDWIRDKRQGHGEMEYLDGSYYDGQWRGDIINGSGIYKHFTGYNYEGLFANGLPNNLTSVKLRISTEFQPDPKSNCINLEAKRVFKIDVRSMIEDNSQEEVFIEEGRKILLTIGIKLDVANTKTYENQVATEFGFSIIPLTIENSSDLKLRNESAIIAEESQNIKLIAGSSTNEHELISNIKKENSQKEYGEILEDSQYIVDSYSSKIPEVVLSNENGQVTFESLYIESIKHPLIEGEAESDAKKSKRRDNSLGPHDGSYYCVIIAEDYSKPAILGHKLKAAYLDCIITNPENKAALFNSKKTTTPAVRTLGQTAGILKKLNKNLI